MRTARLCSSSCPLKTSVTTTEKTIHTAKKTVRSCFTSFFRDRQRPTVVSISMAGKYSWTLMISADRHAGGRGPEQQKQIPREGGDPSATNEQRAYEEGPEEADRRECTQPKEGELWSDLYMLIFRHTPQKHQHNSWFYFFHPLTDPEPFSLFWWWMIMNGLIVTVQCFMLM